MRELYLKTQKLVAQDAPRRLDESMGVGWRLLADLPRADLTRLNDAQIARNVAPPGSQEPAGG